MESMVKLGIKLLVYREMASQLNSEISKIKCVIEKHHEEIDILSRDFQAQRCQMIVPNATIFMNETVSNEEILEKLDTIKRYEISSGYEQKEEQKKKIEEKIENILSELFRLEENESN